MSVEITARHMHDAQGVQDYATGKAEVLVQEFRRIEHVHVILDIEKHRHIAKVVIQARGHIRVEADEVTDDMYVSVDRAFDHVAKQLRKTNERVHDHRAAPRAETAAQ